MFWALLVKIFNQSINETLFTVVILAFVFVFVIVVMLLLLFLLLLLLYKRPEVVMQWIRYV